MNFSKQIATHAAVDPDWPALVFEGRQYSYRDLDCQIGQVAEWLRRRGLQPGDRVALLLPNCPEFVIAHHGTLRIGAVVVAIDGESGPRALAHMLADVDARVVFVTATTAANVNWAGFATRPDVVVVDGVWPDATPMTHLLRGRGCEAVELEPDAPAVILYSSGTTGVPKGVVLSHANLEFNARAKVRYLGIRPDDRLLLFVPLFHVFGQNAILTPALLAGATIVLLRRFHPEQVLTALTERGVTMFFAVPTVYRMLLDVLGKAPPTSVRLWFSAAATLPRELATHWLADIGTPIHEGYGLTETSPFACYNHLERHRIGSVGTPIEEVEVRVIDPDDGTPLATGQRGEVQIRGPNVMLGYWRRPEDTQAAVVDGWFHTGDLGWIDDDGYVFLVDRIKDMIDVAGLKVWPAEVEAVLMEHPTVELAAVHRAPDPDTGERVLASVVLAPGVEFEPARLQRWCRERLKPHEVPSQIERVDALPTSPSGKVLRRVLTANS